MNSDSNREGAGLLEGFPTVRSIHRHRPDLIPAKTGGETLPRSPAIPRAHSA